MMAWVEKYVGLPFVDGGRDWSGVDCWGLVRLVLQNECGIEIQSYGDISAEELMKVAEMVLEDSQKEPWHPVIGARAFDVAVMHRKKAPVHVGIMFDAKYMLHVEKKISAVLIEVTHPSVSFRSIKYYRHRLLLDAARSP